jgi:hypothetical protein
VIDTVKNLDFRSKLEEYVDNCLLNTPEEVARLFKEYTLLVWDYKMIGRIYEFYIDDIILNVEDGKTVVGSEAVVADTLAFTAAIPDNESWFIDIFAEGDSQNGYHFIQSTRCIGTSLGHSASGAPTGRSLSEGGRDCIGLCECHVEKIDGRWKITEEWMVRSGAAINHVMTPGSKPVVFENNINIMLPETTPYKGWFNLAGLEEPLENNSDQVVGEN